jgi:linoleate 10R-lipoxygenase
VLIRLISSESKYTGDSSISEITANKGSIGNLTPVHFAANVFSLPLKTDINPHGVYTEHELYTVLTVMFTCLFLDIDPAKSFPLRQAAFAVSQQLGKLVEANVKAVHSTEFIAGIIDKLHQENAGLKDYGV